MCISSGLRDLQERTLYVSAVNGETFVLALVLPHGKIAGT